MMVCTPLTLTSTNLMMQGILAGARVELSPILPMLILEDIDDHIASTECSDSTIVVHLHDSVSFDVAHSAWSNETDFAVVTNHNDCQTVGEHGARRSVKKDDDLRCAN